MKLLLSIFVSLILICSCKNQNVQKNLKEGPNPTEVGYIPYSKKFKSKNIVFSVNHDHHKSETLKINIANLKKSDYNESLIVKGEIIDGFILDLNNDNYPELYLIFRVNNQSKSLKIYGVSTFNNKSAGPIYINKLDAYKTSETDKIFKENKSLVRTFLNEKKQMVKYNYELEEGEANYQLVPKRIYSKPNR